MSSESLIITRRQIGQWCSYIAGVLLVIGIIGWIWQGGITTPILVVPCKRRPMDY
jgi:hypothetical protein